MKKSEFLDIIGGAAIFALFIFSAWCSLIPVLTTHNFILGSLIGLIVYLLFVLVVWIKYKKANKFPVMILTMVLLLSAYWGCKEPYKKDSFI